MNTDKPKIIELLLDEYLGNLNDQEKQKLNAWINLNSENRGVYERLISKESFKSDFSKMVQQKEDLDRVLNYILSKQDSQFLPFSFNNSWKKIIGYAAVLLTIFSFSFYYLLVNRKDIHAEKIIAAKDILGGENTPYILQQNGKKMELRPNDAIITGENSIQYQDGSAVNIGDLNIKTEKLQLITPRSSTYQITLSDGTRVWLNADSKLKYPNYFSEDQRLVELEGEAYFEVSKMNKPFVVKTLNQEVKVLGTSFNINAYQDANQVKTTLIEGKVNVFNTISKKSLQLLPGQQAQVSKQGMTVTEPEIYDILAWKNGKISFENKSFDEVMNELARWYNLQIVYRGEIPDVTFFGDAYRSNNLEIVLTALQSMDVKYEMKSNRTLVITGRNGGNKSE